MDKKIITDVFKTISRFGMLESSDSVLISISGGPDSIFLTQVLDLLKDEYGLDLYCFHLDHMTRNGESEKDALFVESFCRSKNLRLLKEKIDCRKWCIENRLNFQKGARMLRMGLLKKIAGDRKIKKIALGHNADDNIETFFLHLFRGSGLKGLAGISPVEGKIIRPLIETKRKDILGYLKEKNIDYCVDRTNLEIKYERNKVRNLLVPFIKKNFSKNFDDRLLKTINIIRNEDNLVSWMADKKLEEIADFSLDGPTKNLKSISIPISGLNYFNDGLKKRIFIAAIERIKGNTEDIKSINIEDLLSFCFKGGERKEISLAGNVVFLKQSDKFLFLNTDYKFIGDNKKINYKINIGKEQFLKDFGLRITTRLIEGGLGRLKNTKVVKSEAYIDFDKLKPPLFVKNWIRNSGDRFYPLGSNGLKKLHDFFIDNKVPFNKRTKIPIFVDTEKVIWVGEMRLDERVKIDKNTTKILNIKIF